MGRGLGHVAYFSNFGTPNISGTAEDTNLKFCKWIEGKGPDTKQKCKTGRDGEGLNHVPHLDRVTF